MERMLPGIGDLYPEGYRDVSEEKRTEKYVAPAFNLLQAFKFVRNYYRVAIVNNKFIVGDPFVDSDETKILDISGIICFAKEIHKEEYDYDQHCMDMASYYYYSY